MDFEVLKKLIKLAKDEGVNGLSVEEKGVKYEVDLAGGPSVPSPAPIPHPIPHATHPTPAPVSEEDGLVAISSPMVGTFYRAPSPEAAPFVQPGDEIEPGKVVCIVEAMKLFNEIEAEVRGKIVKVLAENGKPVEYGQKLFLVKKA
ncbi:MAG: acetyl-CoA carboxylase biotin carboxyl carrier protein [Candidatus Saganbacteria bacterium]|nr:acetyl-CoA carboxylase biotin carboxyl carrier protein [Candidatus Saganbacteria bacterium]